MRIFDASLQQERDATPEEIEGFRRAEENDRNIWNSRPYTDKRREEYPPFTDYIDGVVKGDQAQIQAYIDACLAVKAKYPKP